MRLGHSILVAVMMASVSPAVLAQDWIADRLRGGVEQFEGGAWVVLERGDVVPDGRKIRTLGDGRVELIRGEERIAMASNTEIAVRDAAGQTMTSVIQTVGSVTIEAEKRNVQHFSVQTPVLAAVVKGTQFTVTFRNGQARVDVDEGVVQVQDNAHDMVVDVTPGQSAAASQSTPLDVSGPGADRVVYLIDGHVVPAAARDAVLSGALDAEDAAGAVANGTRATVGASASGNGNSSGNGLAVGVGGGNAGGNGNGLAIGVGNSNAGGTGLAVGIGGGNGNSDDTENGGGTGVDVDLGIVDVGVSVGGGNGLRLGLGLGL